MEKFFDFKWECTCDACPEQYDIILNNKKVAYFRLRYGALRVYPYKDGEINWDKVIYAIDFDDDWMGVLRERDSKLIFPKVEQAIIDYIILN